MTIKFENDTEEKFWREVFVATILTPGNVTIGGKKAYSADIADNALEELRERQKENSPYREPV